MFFPPFQAAILQQTSEYIYNLEQERTQLLSQNCYLKRLLAQNDVAQDLTDMPDQPDLGTIDSGLGGKSPAAGSAAAALVPTSTIIMSNVASSNATTTTTSSSSSASAKNPSSGNKKRKMDPVTQIQATQVSDSSDEGLGSMSPEPFTIVLSAKQTKKQQAAAAMAAAELKQQQQTQQAVAELERSQIHGYEEIRTSTEDDVVQEIEESCVDFEIDIDSGAIEETVISTTPSERSVPVQPERSAAPLPKKKRITVESLESDMDGAAGVAVVNGQITKIFRDLSDMHNGPQEIQELQVLNCDSELVLCSAFPGDSAITYEGSGPELKPVKPQQQPQTTTGVARTPVTIIGKLGKAKVAIIDAHTLKETSAVLEKKSKLQPLLDSFNKVENRVEVERITNSPTVMMTVVKEEPGVAGQPGRTFLTPSTSRQNLETIVEAIRHLEGDRFGEQPKNGRNGGVMVKTETLKSLGVELLPTQEVPLALTTKSASVAQKQAELSQFVHFKAKAAGAAGSSSGSAMGVKMSTASGLVGVSVPGQPGTVVLHQLQQCRPGVIVAKQSS